MKTRDRVALIYPPVGWSGVVGRIIDDDQADQFVSDDMVLVEWSNGETCYEKPGGLRLL